MTMGTSRGPCHVSRAHPPKTPTYDAGVAPRAARGGIFRPQRLRTRVVVLRLMEPGVVAGEVVSEDGARPHSTATI